MKKINFKKSCLLPAAVQTVLMILFTAWTLIPEGRSLPSNAVLMPYFLFATIIVFAWNLIAWLMSIVRTQGKDNNWFWTAFLIIIIDIAIMGYLMTPAAN